MNISRDTNNLFRGALVNKIIVYNTVAFCPLLLKFIKMLVLRFDPTKCSFRHRRASHCDSELYEVGSNICSFYINCLYECNIHYSLGAWPDSLTDITCTVPPEFPIKNVNIMQYTDLSHGLRISHIRVAPVAVIGLENYATSSK